MMRGHHGEKNTFDTQSTQESGNSSPRGTPESSAQKRKAFKRRSALTRMHLHGSRVHMTPDDLRAYVNGLSMAFEADWFSRKVSWDNSWSRSRKGVAEILNSHLFEITVSIIMMVHMIVVVLETDARAHDTSAPWLQYVGWGFLCAYTLELLGRIYVERSLFIFDLWNLYDLVVVLTDIICEIIGELIGNTPSVSALRMVRIVRMLRVVRFLSTLSFFRELFMMLHAFLHTMRAIAWAFVFISVVMTFWSILAVQIIRPISQQVLAEGGYENCPRCPRAFDTVIQSNLTFLQTIIAGDSWGTTIIPIIDRTPATALFFVIVHATLGLGMLNLVLTVIVDRAAEARAQDTKQTLREKAQERGLAKDRMINIFADMDCDKDGMLSYREFAHGFKTNKEFKEDMALMDITLEEMGVVFEILDEDQSGKVSIREFMNQLYKMKAQDSHTLLVLIKHWVQDSRRKIMNMMQQHTADLKEQDLVMVKRIHELERSIGVGTQKTFVPVAQELAPSEHQQSNQFFSVGNSTKLAHSLREADAENGMANDSKATSIATDIGFDPLELQLEKLQCLVDDHLAGLSSMVHQRLNGCRCSLNGAPKATSELARAPLIGAKIEHGCITYAPSPRRTVDIWAPSQSLGTMSTGANEADMPPLRNSRCALRGANEGPRSTHFNKLLGDQVSSASIVASLES